MSPFAESSKLVTSLISVFFPSEHTQHIEDWAPMQKPMEKRIRRCGNLLAVVALALVVSAMLPPSGEAKLSPDYYRSTCPDVRGDRAGGGGQEGQGDLRHGPGHAQALLPRLLRRGEPHPPVPAAACSCNQRAESKGSIRNRTWFLWKSCVLNEWN